MNVTAIILFCLLILSSCKYSEEPAEVLVDDKFQISFPSYMEEVGDLNPEAVVQYENAFRSRYAVVLFDNNVNIGLKAYADSVSKALAARLEKPVMIKTDAEEVNGIETYEQKLSGLVTDERVYYHLVFYKADAGIYQLVMWARDDKKDGFLQEMEEIKQSFKPSR